MLQCSQPSQMPAGHVQDGFPQQRGWSDRSLEIVPVFATRADFHAVTFPIPLKPPIVAAGASSRTMKIEPLSVDFTDEQKRYLEGFTSGLQISRVGRGLGGSATGNAE